MVRPDEIAPEFRGPTDTYFTGIESVAANHDSEIHSHPYIKSLGFGALAEMFGLSALIHPNLEREEDRDLKDREKRQEQGMTVEVAATNYSIEYQQLKSAVSRRLEEGNFLVGANWANDFQTSAKFAKLYLENPNPTTDDNRIANDVGMALVTEADTSQKLQQVVEDPNTRRLHNASIFMTFRALSDPNFDLAKGSDYDSINAQIKEHLDSLDNKEFDGMWSNCLDEAKSCEKHLTPEQAQEQAKAFNKYEKIMKNGGFPDKFVALRDISDPQERKAALREILQEGVRKLAEEDPKAAKIISEEMNRFRSDNQRVESSSDIYGSFIASSRGSVNLWSEANESKTKMEEVISDPVLARAYIFADGMVSRKIAMDENLRAKLDGLDPEERLAEINRMKYDVYREIEKDKYGGLDDIQSFEQNYNTFFQLNDNMSVKQIAETYKGFNQVITQPNFWVDYQEFMTTGVIIGQNGEEIYNGKFFNPDGTKNEANIARFAEEFGQPEGMSKTAYMNEVVINKVGALMYQAQTGKEFNHPITIDKNNFAAWNDLNSTYGIKNSSPDKPNSARKDQKQNAQILAQVDAVKADLEKNSVSASGGGCSPCSVANNTTEQQKTQSPVEQGAIDPNTGQSPTQIAAQAGEDPSTRTV